MAYTVTELITGAYYESSLVAREFEIIQGYQLNDALNWLNQILLDNTVDAGEIPYITTWLQFNATAGQEKYFVANLVDIQSIVFFIQSVRYEMKFVGRKKYFSTPRANNINALPLSYTYERTYGGVNLFLYFFPDQAYTMQIAGNMYMTPVSLNQDLTVCVANLGVPVVPGNSLGAMTVLGTGVLGAGELVINGVDVAGTYTTPSAFVTYINSGVVPNTKASIVNNSIVTLINPVTALTLTTLGTVAINGITFANFSTTGGALTKTFPASGTLSQGQLVVNGVDLQGTYYGAQDLVNYINTGVVPNVTAGFNGNDFILTSQWGGSQIQVQTIGKPSTTNNITFQNFSTLNGLYQVQYTALDQFYIDYLQYKLAARICTKNNFAIPPTVREQLDIYRQKIIKMAEPMDLQLQKTSVLTRAIGVNWAQANIGKGWSTNGGY